MNYFLQKTIYFCVKSSQTKTGRNSALFAHLQVPQLAYIIAERVIRSESPLLPFNDYYIIISNNYDTDNTDIAEKFGYQ